MLTLALLAGGIWLAIFAYDRGFTNKWKNYIIKELEKHGIAAQIERLTIDPINGLTARNVSFFDLTNRRQHLVSISHVSLDVDLAKIVDGEDFLRTVDLRDASLSLPVEPDQPNGPSVEITKLNARLHFEGDRVDFSRAEGNVAGIHVNVRGSMDLPKKPNGTKDEIERQKKERQKQLDEIKKRRGALKLLVQFLDKFKSEGLVKARLDIDLDGPLSNLKQLRAGVRLRAEKLTCGTFNLEKLDAQADLSDGVVSVRQFEIHDKGGKLTGQAFWRPEESKDIDFWIDSSVDVHALMKGLWGSQSLGEVVFYQTPHLRADGKYFLGDPIENGSLPVDLVARFDCHRFTTHGIIFDGFHGDFAIKGAEFNARNILLEHESGTATGRFMRTQEGGFKYHLKWNVSLAAAMPFVESEPVQQALAAFEFEEDSSVSVEAVGAGGDLNPASWTGSVQMDLRSFSYRDVRIKAARADVTLAGGKAIFRDVLVQRPEGNVKVAQINLDAEEKSIELQQMVITAFPLPMVRAFVPFIARHAEPYTFSVPPTLVVNGKIYATDSMKSDLLVNVNAPQKLKLSLAGQASDISSASGTLHWKNDVLALDLVGKGAPGSNHSGVTFDREPSLKFVAGFGVGTKLNKVHQWKLNVAAVEGAHIAFAGKQVPTQSVLASVESQFTTLTVEATSRVYGGGLLANFAFPDTSKPTPYHALVTLDKVSYSRLAKLFDPTKETAGLISGSLNFTGLGGNMASLKGNGRLIINDGDVFAIPLLGPLSKLFSTLLPVGKLIYSTAREAIADIVVENGTASTKNFEAQTSTFKLVVDGLIDYMNNRVDMNARMNLRGAPGLLLYPVSKLFEYEANGTMAEPNWRPKYLSLPFNDAERKQAPVPDNEAAKPPVRAPSR